MLNSYLLLVDGAVLTVVFTTFVVGTLLWRPRLWLQDFPDDLQALIPPQTGAEKRLMAFLAVPWIGLLVVGLIVTGARYGTEQGHWAMLVHVYLVWQVVNLFDLIVIDWGGMHLIDPQNPPFPRTENAPGYRNYRFHFVAFLKGSAIGIAMALLATTAAWILTD